MRLGGNGVVDMWPKEIVHVAMPMGPMAWMRIIMLVSFRAMLCCAPTMLSAHNPMLMLPIGLERWHCGPFGGHSMVEITIAVSVALLVKIVREVNVTFIPAMRSLADWSVGTDCWRRAMLPLMLLSVRMMDVTGRWVMSRRTLRADLFKITSRARGTKWLGATWRCTDLTFARRAMLGLVASLFDTIKVQARIDARQLLLTIGRCA